MSNMGSFEPLVSYGRYSMSVSSCFVLVNWGQGLPTLSFQALAGSIGTLLHNVERESQGRRR